MCLLLYNELYKGNWQERSVDPVLCIPCIPRTPAKSWNYLIKDRMTSKYHQQKLNLKWKVSDILFTPGWLHIYLYTYTTYLCGTQLIYPCVSKYTSYIYPPKHPVRRTSKQTSSLWKCPPGPQSLRLECAECSMVQVPSRRKSYSHEDKG